MLRTSMVVLVVACGHSSDPPATAPAAIPGVELAELAYGGREIPAQAPLVIVSPRAISVEGMAIVRIENGAVDAAEKEGGALGMKMPRLALALGRLPGGGHNQPLEVAVDRSLTYRVMIEVLFTAKQKEAGWKEFALLARAHTGGAIVAIPLTLPDRAPPEKGIAHLTKLGTGGPRPENDGSPADVPKAKPNPEPEPEPELKPVVTVTKTEIIVWSISGIEGTLQQPLLRVARSDATATAQVTRTLADIIKRRWSGKPRPETSRSLIFMADSAVAMSTVIEMLGAIRATPEGGVLFPDVLLSSGFE